MHALTILTIAGLCFTALWSILSYSGHAQFEFYRLSRLIRHPFQRWLGHRPPPAMSRREFIRQFNEGNRVGYRLTAMGRLTEDDADIQLGIMNTVYSAVSQQRKALQDSIDGSSDRITGKINQLTALCQSLDRKMADNQSVLIVRGIKLEEEHNITQRLAQSIRDEVLTNQQTLADIKSSVRKILRQVSCGSVLTEFNGGENNDDDHGDGAAGHQEEPTDEGHQVDGAIGGAISRTGGATAHTGGGGHSDSDIEAIEAIELDTLVNPAAADHIMKLLDREVKPKKELQFHTPVAIDTAPPPTIKKEPGCFGNLNKTVSYRKPEGKAPKK